MEFINPYKDRWHLLGHEDGPPVSIRPVPHLLLDLSQWHAVRAHWPEGMPVGVKVGNEVDVEDFVADLPLWELVALCFPKWVDGRAYSQARLLRSRYRFKGEIRATGEVLVDMLPLLQRCGFSSAVLRADQSIDAAHRALGFFPGHYQGDAQNHLPLFARPPGTADALTKGASCDFVSDGAAI